MLRLLLSSCIALVAVCPQGQAQHYKLNYVHGSAEGEQLELIEHQVETARKIEQMERFLRQFPRHESTSYLLEWLQIYYVRDNQPDKVLEYGNRLLAAHPDDFDVSCRMQAAADRKKDPALIKEWNDRMLQLSEKVVAARQPGDQDPAAWKQTVEMARSLLAQREYEMFANGIEAANSRTKTQLLEEFVRRYPDSKYTNQVWPHLMNAYRDTGDSVKAIAVAEKLLVQDPNDLDALLLNAQLLLEKKLNPQKMATYASRVLAIVPTRAKPDNYSAADWERRKAYYLGSAHLLIGNMYVGQNNFQMADKSLKQSLPYMHGNEQVEAAILFYLGWANYHMENYREAAGFFRQCMSITGPYAEQAVRNLNSMKTDRRLVE